MDDNDDARLAEYIENVRAQDVIMRRREESVNTVEEISNHQVTDRQCPTRPLSQNEHSLSGPGSVSHWSGSPTDTRHPVLRKRTIHEDEEGEFVLEKTLCAASHEFFDYGRYILCKETFIIQLKYTEGLVSGFNRNRQSLMLNHFKLNGTPSQKMLLEPLS